MSGLLGVTTPPQYCIEGKGRGLLLLEPVREGSYVLEYGAVVYPRRERAVREREYVANGEGCYIIDAQTSQGWMCFDATRRFLSPGRLMNHEPRGKATLTPFKPLLIGGKWRLGFVATRDLQPGQELTWDYCCAPGGIDWLKKRPNKSASGERKLSLCLHDCRHVHMHCTLYVRANNTAGSTASHAPSAPISASKPILSEAPPRHRGKSLEWSLLDVSWLLTLL